MNDAYQKLKNVYKKRAVSQLEKEINIGLQSPPPDDYNFELPKTRHIYNQIASAMLWAMDNGYPDVTVRDVIPSIYNNSYSEFCEFVKNLPEFKSFIAVRYKK